MIVLDASFLIDTLLRTSGWERIESRLLRSSEMIAAPELIDIEVCQVLRRLFLLKEISKSRSQEAIDDLLLFPLRRYPHEFLLERIWQLKENFTAYDAAYIALAERLDATLLTRDKKMASVAKKFIKIELH